VSFNAFQFHKLVGIAYSTAFAILKKISVAAHTAMQDDDIVHLPSSLFSSVFKKRSRQTPAGKTPLAEEDISNTLADNQTESEAEATLPPGCEEPPTIQDPMERAIYECLSLKPLPYDSIFEKLGAPPGELSAALTLLELSELVKRLPGDRYIRSSRSSGVTGAHQSIDEPQTKLVAQVIKYIRKTFGGISRKYLQNYISMHWCHSKTKRSKQNSLLDLCFK